MVPCVDNNAMSYEKEEKGKKCILMVLMCVHPDRHNNTSLR